MSKAKIHLAVRDDFDELDEDRQSEEIREFVKDNILTPKKPKQVVHNPNEPAVAEEEPDLDKPMLENLPPVASKQPMRDAKQLHCPQGNTRKPGKGTMMVGGRMIRMD